LSQTGQKTAKSNKFGDWINQVGFHTTTEPAPPAEPPQPGPRPVESAPITESAIVDSRQPAVEPPVPVQRVASRLRIPKPRKQGRSSNPAYTQITAYVPNEQHLDVKQQLLRQGNRDLSDLVEELFKSWLAAGAPRYATVQKADSTGRT
jgi:hypothetical protein